MGLPNNNSNIIITDNNNYFCCYLFVTPRIFSTWTSHQATQPPTLSVTGNKYQLMVDDELGLGSKGRYGSLHIMDKRVGWQVKLCDPTLTRANLSVLWSVRLNKSAL